MRLPFVNRNHVPALPAPGTRLDHPVEQTRRDVPPLAAFGDDGDGLFVVAREYADQQGSAFGLKRNPVADREIEHARVRTRLVQKAQALYDAVIGDRPVPLR